MYVRRSEEDIQDVFWTSYLLSIYVLCPGGIKVSNIAEINELFVTKYLFNRSSSQRFFFLNFKAAGTASKIGSLRFTKSTAQKFRSSPQEEVVLGKSVRKICSKFTGEHPWQKMLSINLVCNFIEITLWHGRSPVNLLRIFRTHFLRAHLEGCFWKWMVWKKVLKFQNFEFFRGD